MRKSRVVNLGDNILCETFLFLVQRELQRQQGRATHSHCLPQSTQGCRQTGVAVVLPPPRTARVANRTENGAQCARCFWPVQKQRRRRKETTTLARELCPFPILLSLHKVWGCVCAGAAVGALLLPHFIVFVVLPSSSSRSGPWGGGWACWSWWFRGCSV